jgi:hypothetical protein
MAPRPTAIARCGPKPVGEAPELAREAAQLFDMYRGELLEQPAPAGGQEHADYAMVVALALPRDETLGFGAIDEADRALMA